MGVGDTATVWDGEIVRTLGAAECFESGDQILNFLVFYTIFSGGIYI